MQMNKKINKVLAGILIFVMTFADMAFIGKSAFVYAADVVLEKQNSKTTNSNVEFDAYFLTENNDKSYSTVKDVNDENVSINIALNVKNAGYLKDAQIEFKDTEEKGLLNYKVKDNLEANDIIQSFEDNKLKLKLINNMTKEQIISIPIEYYQEEYTSLDKISKDTKLEFKAVYVDNKGKEININKEIVLNVGWKDDSSILVESTMEKYIPYNVEGKSGVILQTIVKVSSDKRNKILPVQETTIDIDAPKIDGVEIANVQVVAKSTMATDGKSNELVKFNTSNWNYDEKNKKINIKIQNDKKEDGTYYSAYGSDEFIVTYTYSQDAYNKIVDNQINLKSNITAKVTRYSAESKKEITKTLEAEYDLSKKMGDLVSYTVENNVSEITKGYIYANYNKEGNLYETEFNSKAIVNISYKDMVEEILLKDTNQYFENKEGSKFDSNDLYYKEISFNKENILQILGKDGNIQILDSTGNLLKEIKDFENILVDTNGNYIVKFDDKTKSISIKMSKPIAEGNINIGFKKAIEKVSYEKSISKDFTKIVSETELLSKYTYVDEYVNISKIETTTNLLETVSDAKLYISKNYLSTLVTNDNVELRVELNNNKVESDMYGNSTFEIQLPEYIENIEISEAKMVYGEGLEIETAELLKRDNHLVIRVTTKGKQKDIITNTNLTDGSNILTNGTNIVFNTKIDINMFTPSKEDEIKLYYTNDDYTNYKSEENGYGYYAEKIEYNAPTGLVAINGTKNYNEKNNTIYSINSGKVEDIIEILTDAKLATMEILLMNNNNNKVTDLNILGRFPFKGNKSVVSNEDLKTTVDTAIKTAIIPSANNNINAVATIYYSSNENASKDLTNVNNGWTTDLGSLQNPKSYLIVLNKDYEMQPSEVLKFEYQYEIPAGLEHNNNISANYAVYYTNNTDVATLSEVQESEVIGVTTGEGPVLKLELQSNADSQIVKECQEIIYTAKVTNAGDLPAKNVVVSIDTPDYTKLKSYSVEDSNVVPQYVDNKISFAMNEISAGTSKEMKIYVDVDKVPSIEEYYSNDERFSMTDDGKYCLIIEKENPDDPENPTYEEQIIENLDDIKISAVANLTAEDLAKTISSPAVTSTVKEAEFSITESTEDSSLIIKENKEIEYDIIVNNLTTETKNDVIVKAAVPEGVTFKDAYIVDEENSQTAPQYNESTREVVWNLGNLNGKESKQLKLRVITDKLREGITKTTLYSNSVVYANGTESYKSNTVETNIGRASLVVGQTTDKENTYIKEGDTVKYLFTIKNEGTVDADNVSFTDTIPDGLKVNSIEYTVNGSTSTRTISGTNSATFKTSIAPGETVNATVTVVAANLNGAAEKSVTNYATIDFDEESKKTNSITHIIEANNNNSNTNDPEKSQQSNNKNNNSNNNSNTNNSSQTSKTFKISGTAWIDENENGMRDSNESKISGIAVKLINSNTNSIEKETITNGSGDYTFSGLNKGNYFIVFEYDTLKYGLTEYKKENIATNVNSDVIATKIEQDGKIKNAAVTDTITLDTVSISNIDIGFVNAKKFDLSLNKTISKITTQTQEGTTSTTFDNVKLAKPEISAKYMSGSTVLVEYTISITNNGDIEGTASKIVDYIPEGMKFNSSLNPNWYSGSDGNIYTSELENITINPGETAEVKVVLTKTITDEYVGLINNQAEIYEDYNIYGISDKNSTPGNKAQGEDDMNYADVIISVRTGESLIYVSVIIISLIILGTGIFLIRTQVTKKRKEV